MFGNTNKKLEEAFSEKPTISNPVEAVVMLPCPVCGGKPEVEWGGVSEFHGKAEQDLTIDCENDHISQHHGFTVSITIDTNGTYNGDKVEQIAKEAWNKMAS